MTDAEFEDDTPLTPATETPVDGASLAGLPLALDAMGGDKGIPMVLGGAELAMKRAAGMRFAFYGDEAKIREELAKRPALSAVSEVVHASEIVSSHDIPSVALRKARQSSMRLAIDAVRDGRASGVVSAGNTGAFMAMAKFVLKMLPGISRPAIIGRFPNKHGDMVMLDLGANVQCSPKDLYDFAVMGNAYSKIVLGRERPRIGVLNIGSEEMKGHEELRQAASMLREKPLGMNFIGFVEGNDICNGPVDVIVTDGFTGNIALKTAEGTSHFMYMQIKSAFSASIWRKLSYLVAKPAFGQFKKVLDPRRLNGAIFIGLNGVAVKSHGGADAEAFASAVVTAHRMVSERINEKITRQLSALDEKDEESASLATSSFARFNTFADLM